MVHLVKKTNKGHVYLYLRETARVNGRVKTVWQKYLGPEERVKSAPVAELALHAKTPPIIRTYAFGLPVALMLIAERLDLVRTINRATAKRQQGLSVGHYVALAALNRCVHPVTKRHMQEWFEGTYLKGLFPEVTTYLDSVAYTNHFAYLTDEAIDTIQKELGRKVAAEFGVDMSQLTYDPTNFSTYMNPAGDRALAKHGHAKDNKATLNLVGLALVCTQDGGIPLMYDVYSGNLQDATVFQAELPAVLEHVSELVRRPSKVTLTFDKGNNSETVFQQLAAAEVSYIASLRPSMVKDLVAVPSELFPLQELPNGKHVGVLEFTRELYGLQQRVIVAYNPEKARWSGDTLYAKLTDDVAAVEDYFRKRLNKKMWRKKAAVQKKVESLVGKSHLEFLRVDLQGEDGSLVLQLTVDQDALNTHASTLGKSFLISNHPAMSAAELVELFRQQITIERAFSYLKNSDLCPASPIFHSCDASIQGHLFSCVIGLLLVTLLAREVQKVHPEKSLEHICELLSSVTAATVQASPAAKVIKTLTEMPPEAQELVDFLQLNTYL
jgi:transposase